LFPSPKTGRAYGTNFARDCVHRVCEAAKVPVICAHGARGTYSTLTQEDGIPADEVAAALGHANPEVTERHYTKPGTRERVEHQRFLKLVEEPAKATKKAAG